MGVFVSEASSIRARLRIPHPQSNIIGKNIEIGYNARIYQQVTIGASPKSHSGILMRMGNDVVVYPGAKFVGDACVGNNCVVGANAVVTKQFGDNVVLAGVPAKVIRFLETGERSADA